MPFQKGMQKTGGRVKNQPNKTSKELNAELKNLLHQKIDLPLACIEEIKRCVF